MSVREYVGARYVPIMMGDWDNTKAYEPLSIVQYLGDSYTSRQYVPAGVSITNEEYWAPTGNYNAQVEAYRQEVQAFDGRIDALETAMDDALSGLAIRQSEFTISPILLGCIVYSKENGMFDHPGCICDCNNGTQWLFSSPQPYVSNAGHARSISIQANKDYFANYNTMDLGHANSAAFDSVHNKIWVCPVWDQAGGQTNVYADYLYRFTPGDAASTKVTISIPESPIQIMGVSYDSVTDKLYMFTYSDNIYELDPISLAATFVKHVVRDSNYNQDFAIHNGQWVISHPSGYLLCGSLDNDEQTIANVAHVDSSFDFIWGELDGFEFTEDGRLLAVAHSDQLDDRPTFIYELPVYDFIQPWTQYMMPQSWVIGADYTLYVDQSCIDLRTDGLTSAKGLKSFNFLNLLADTTQRSVILATDYTCDNLRLGNDSYNWISFNNKTLTIRNTFTVQTALIMNGTGKLHVGYPIQIGYGIARLGFANSLSIQVDNPGEENPHLIAQYPVGAFVSFGDLGTIQPSGLKMFSAAQETIAAGQVYILGTMLNA